MHRTMQLIDLFCGGGGFSTGAKHAGCNIVLAIDNWKPALSVHQANHPTAVHLHMTLGTQSSKEMKDIFSKHLNPDLPWHLHGSPPCQKISTINQKKTARGAQRNPLEGLILVTWYLEMVRDIKPTTWSMEQVPACLHIIPKKLIPDGSTIMIIDASWYGVPQNRKRLYLGKGWTIHPDEFQTAVSDVMPALADEGDGLRNSVRSRKSGTKGNYVYSKDNVTNVRPLNRPSYTLCASQPLDLVVKPEWKYVRMLTPEECLLLQGFPEEYDLADLKRVEEYTVIGNAVCPPVAARIMRSVQLDLLDVLLREKST
jgi:DNA (cytosine-5)-methyltransferase 1